MALIAQGATLGEAAAAVGVSHQSVAIWRKADGVELRRRVRRPQPVDPVVKGERRPIYVNGIRLGRLAPWT